jgi:hypothetical protein
VPDQRSLLRGRLASAIDGVVDVASRLDPPGARAAAPPLPPPADSVARPWTLAAAMEPIATPVVERTVQRQSTAPPPPPPEPPPPLEHHRSRLPAAIVGSSVVGLVLVLVVLHLLQSSGAVRSPAPSQIALTGIRPVATAPPAGGAVPQTQVSFPANTSTVDIEVNSGRAGGQAPVRIVVTVGQPAQTIIQHDYVLNQSGSTVIPLTPANGAFAPGDYRVTITYRGALLGATAFAVH